MKVQVEYTGGRSFKTQLGDHAIITDLPETKGGENAGPTPSELFITSLATCMGIYATSYLHTAKLNTEGFAIDVDWDYSEDHQRIGKIDVTVTVPNAELGARKKALMAAMGKCVMHNTIQDEPEINTIIAGD